MADAKQLPKIDISTSALIPSVYMFKIDNTLLRA